MEKERTYVELLQCVPSEVKKAFEEIESGTRLPDLCSDLVFKKIFDPDIHKDRVGRLLSLIFNKDMEVISSLKQEIPKTTIYGKSTVNDLVAKLSSGSVANIEMQVLAQEFIVERMDIYASDLILLQYSVEQGMKKTDFIYRDVKSSYLVVFMKKSPQIFCHTKEFIHFKKSITDTGVELNQLAKIVYIELEKCISYVKEYGIDEDNRELYEWLMLVADVNDKELVDTIDLNEHKVSILNELVSMSKNKEELMAMLSEKYAQVTRNSENAQFREQGLADGKREGMQLMTLSIIRNMYIQNMDIAEMSRILNKSESEVIEVIKRIELHPNMTDEELMELT